MILRRKHRLAGSSDRTVELEIAEFSRSKGGKLAQ